MIYVVLPLLAVVCLGILTFRAIKHERERFREEIEQRDQEFAGLPERVELALEKTSNSTVNYRYGLSGWEHLIKIVVPLLGVIGLQWVLGDINNGISINGIDLSPAATTIFFKILMSALSLIAGLAFVEACNQIGRCNVVGLDPVAIEFPCGWPLQRIVRIPFSEITNLSGEGNGGRGANNRDLLIQTVKKSNRLKGENLESEIIYHELRELLEAKIAQHQSQAS